MAYLEARAGERQGLENGKGWKNGKGWRTARAGERSDYLLDEQVRWHWVEAVGVVGVDVGIVRIVLAGGIVRYVEKLVVEVVGVSDSMFVVSAVPNLSGGLLANSEGVSALDVLDAFCRRLV